MNRILIFIIFSLLLSACSDSGLFQSESSKRIWRELEANEFKAIDFSNLGGSKWTKVCFLGPYNQNSQKALGFTWDVSDHTDVLKSDGHNVIIFSTDSKVIEYIIHSRRYGDFGKLSGECLERENSKLIRDSESGNRRNYVHEPKA